VSYLLAIEEADPRIKAALDPAIYVEPRDKAAWSEIQRQVAVVTALRKLGLIVFAVPNSTQSSRSKLRQFREGAVYGAADLIVTWRNGVAFVEMKDATSFPRENQVDFLNRLHRQGQHVAVCRSAAGAVEWLKRVGAPIT
jgi:hypothetical protein